MAIPPAMPIIPPAQVNPFPTPAPHKNSGERGLSMIVHGPSGVGKTSVISHFPRPGWIIDSQEQGVRYLLSRKLIPEPVFITELPSGWKSWEQLIKECYLAAGSPIDTLIIESLTGFENICFQFHAKQRFATSEFPDGDITGGDTGFYAYQKGPKNAARFDWPNLMEALNTVLQSGKNVIITGHSFEKETTSPEGVKYQKHTPVAEPQIWTRLARWASIVMFFGYKIEQDADKSRGALKKVARSSLDRLMYIEPTPYCEAKNWLGMKGVISAGNSGEKAYQNFMRALGV